MKAIRWGIALLLMLPVVATAADKDQQAIMHTLRHNIQGLRIDAVRPAPIAGLYEIVSGRNIYYSDLEGHHLIAGGHIFDTSNRRDLTAARLQELNRIDWKILPLDKAIVSGDPKGLPLAVFTDPDCPFCRRLEKELQHVKGVRVYSFLFPLTQLHKHAEEHAKAIWCAKDRHQAMMDIMLNNKPVAKGSCATPIAEIHALGVKLGISGTPTMIAGDGRLFPGLKKADDLKAWLEAK